jgi:hypothetical protein
MEPALMSKLRHTKYTEKMMTKEIGRDGNKNEAGTG